MRFSSEGRFASKHDEMPLWFCSHPKGLPGEIGFPGKQGEAGKPVS